MRGSEGQLVGGRYRLGATVGRGGMGRVWRARDETLDREVAVKELLIPAELPAADRADLIARTMREARAAARLRHSGIITIHDVVEDGGVPWVVMEFVDGPSLGGVIKTEGRLSRERVAAIGADLADALAHAHSLGIVHRDLKPDNVLLAGQRAVITDFGIARIMDVETRITHTGTVIGTPKFMSPEQLENRAVEAPSDVWSLGVTLYSAAEGRPPFEGSTLTALVTAILTQPMPAAEAAGPLAPMLAAMLSKDAGQRPDAGAVRDGLRSLTDRTVTYQAPQAPQVAQTPQAPQTPQVSQTPHTPPIPQAPPPVANPTLLYEPTKVEEQPLLPRTRVEQQHVPQADYATERMYGEPQEPGGRTQAGLGPAGAARIGGPTGPMAPAGRGSSGAPGQDSAKGPSRRAVLGGAAAVVAIAGGAVGAAKLLGPGHKTGGTTGAAGNSSTLTGSASGAGKTSGATPAATPVSSASASPSAPVLDPQSPVTFTGHTDKIFAVVYSPDGSKLASASSDKSIRLWDVAGDSRIATLTGHGNTVYSVVFSPDGTKLASGGADGTVRIWDADSHKSIRVLAPPTGSGLVGPVAVSPDNKLVAGGSADGGIRIWAVDSGELQGTLTGHSAVVQSLAFSPDGKLLASASSDKTARLWDMTKSDYPSVATLQKHTDEVHGIAFSPDGKRVATAGFDKVALVWDVATQSVVGTLSGHTDHLESVTFSGDGFFLATGSWDTTTRLWSAADFSNLKVLKEHSQSVENVVFSPDSASVASCSWDKTIVLWKLR